MKLNLKRKVSKFSSTNIDYGKITITAKELAPFIGKEVNLIIEVEE